MKVDATCSGNEITGNIIGGCVMKSQRANHFQSDQKNMIRINPGGGTNKV